MGWLLARCLSLLLTGAAEAAAPGGVAGDVGGEATPVDAQVASNVRLEVATARLQRVHDMISAATTHREQARQDRDVIKLNYIDAKLNAMRALAHVSEQSEQNLQEALAQHDSAAADHEEEKLAIAESKVARLFAESQAAVGEIAVYSGATHVQVTVDESIAGPAHAVIDALAASRPDNAVIVMRPPAASPYQ